MNGSKSDIFASGILNSIQSATQFVIGELPVRYLGVLLVTKQLSARDCKPLVDKINARVQHWTSRFLIYAGRL